MSANFSRATFDTFFHSFDFGFSSDQEALKFVSYSHRDFSLDNKALHEYTHLLFNASPVTRAVRALRTKSFVALSKSLRRMKVGRDAEVDKAEVFRAVNGWRVGEAINQYLLPLYEAAALLAEFELSLFPQPELADQLTIQDLYFNLVFGMIRNESVIRAGEHRSLGIPDPVEAALLDCISSRLLSDEVVARKLTVLNQPLSYTSPDKCYLLAWLLAKQWQRSISSAIDEHADPWFCIKYMRSFFFEDWTLVRHILNLHSGITSDTAAVTSHLQKRLNTFSHSFSRETYETYRQGVLDMHESPESVHYELLPGLLRDMSDNDCATVSSELERASFEAMLHLQTDEDDKEIETLLTVLHNKSIHVTIHTGEYEVWTDGNLMWCESGSACVQFTLLRERTLAKATRQVTFVLAPSGDVLKTIAYVEADNVETVAYLGDEEPNAGVVLAAFSIRQNIWAETTARRYVSTLSEIFADEIKSAIGEGIQTAKSIYLNWLTDQGQFTVELLNSATRQGFQPFDNLPSRTFSQLFRKYLSSDEMTETVRNSLRFGSGYNAGFVARGNARRHILHPTNRILEIKLKVAMSNDGIDLSTFYVDYENDGSEIPRYSF